MSSRLLRALASAGVILVLLITSCAAPNNVQPTPTVDDMVEPTPDDMDVEPTPTPDDMDVDPTPTPDDEDVDVEPTPDDVDPDDEDLTGQVVNILGVWAGSELEAFQAMVQPWEERTGAQMTFEATRDVNAVLRTRVDGGNPPDMVGLPGPGQVAIYAEENQLVDLSEFLDMDYLQENYADNWIELSTHNDTLYAIFVKADLKSFVWYSPPAFEEAGYEVPETWDEMIALSDQIVADGGTPWCIGVESGAASGWAGTDWIEDIMLRTAGPEVYDQWYRHEIAWTSEEVRNAWETWGEIVNNPDYVDGGATGVLATNFGESVYGLLEDPPFCYMHRQATFIEGFLTDQFPDAEAQVDYDFFLFPPIDEEHGSPMLVAGSQMVAFNDTPAVRSLMQWLITAEAQSIWAERGAYIAPNTGVDPDVYPDEVNRQAAQLLAEVEEVRFDASDMMPSAVNQAFWSGILNYIENPGQLDQILQNIEDVAQESY
jgi:alpha-glucoside transport system substrate-binding protein